MLIIVLTFERNSNVGITLVQNYFVKLLFKKMHKERRRERERNMVFKSFFLDHPLYKTLAPLFFLII
jgi:hypothetical protein